MAKRGDVIRDFEDADEDERDDSPVEKPEIEDELPLSDAVRAALAGFGGGELEDATISVSEKGEGRKAGAWLFSYGADEKDPEEILQILRDEYGGGDFRIAIRSKGKYVFNRAVSVRAPKSADFLKVNRPDNSGTENLLSKMLDRLDNSKKGDDTNLFLLMMQQQQESTKLLVEAMKSSQAQPDKSSTKELLEMMVMLKGINGDDNKKDSGSELEMFMRGLEMGRDLGESTTDSPLAQVAKTLGQMVTQAQIAPPPAPVPRNPQPRPQLPASAHETKQALENSGIDLSQYPEDEQMMMLDLLPYQALLQPLMVAAQKNADPVTYADWALDQLPENLIEKYLVSDKGYNALMGKLPAQMQPFRAWFDEWRESVLDLRSPDTDDAGDVSDNGPDTGPAISDAEPVQHDAG